MSVGKEKNGTYTVQCWYREQLTGERHKKTKRSFKRCTGPTCSRA